jgi:hypothetical protein
MLGGIEVNLKTILKCFTVTKILSLRLSVNLEERRKECNLIDPEVGRKKHRVL